MDRNLLNSQSLSISYLVALRKESVDRNSFSAGTKCDTTKSLSARRAWIEIPILLAVSIFIDVALRKESVDRNKLCHAQRGTLPDVALRKESVDRNIYLTQKHKG